MLAQPGLPAFVKSFQPEIINTGNISIPNTPTAPVVNNPIILPPELSITILLKFYLKINNQAL